VSGRLAILALLLFAALFAAALWYFQTRAYYRWLDPAEVTINLTPLAGGPSETIAIDSVQAIDAPTSPLKFRACFTTRSSLAMLTETYAPAPEADPLVAPAWFDCFDAARIGADLAEGAAVAFLAEAGIAPGADRIVAIYPDGRGFAWHRLRDDAAAR
jgi:hypothetical protein